MGPSTDPLAVVDPQLQVYGIDGLRVMDASVMPEVVSGNTFATIVTIAEKGVDMMKQKWMGANNLSNRFGVTSSQSSTQRPHQHHHTQNHQHHYDNDDNPYYQHQWPGHHHHSDSFHSAMPNPFQQGGKFTRDLDQFYRQGYVYQQPIFPSFTNEDNHYRIYNV